MADIKISEMPELLDSGSGTGVDAADFLAILDQDEPDINAANKKVRLSTLHEFLAPLDSPILTGTPFSTTPPVGNNSTRIATTEYVQNELGASLTLDSLQDVTNPGTPLAGQALIYDDVTGTFVVKSLTATNREILTADKALTLASATYQFLDPNGTNRDVILPPGQAGTRFVIKNLDVANTLNIVEVVSGPTQATIDINSPVAEVIHDGTEYHIINF